MTYRVVQAPGCAVLRPDYDAVFATEAEAQALLDWWEIQYPNVHWKVERCESLDYPVNAEWVGARIRRLDTKPNFPTRTPAGRTRQP